MKNQNDTNQAKPNQEASEGVEAIIKTLAERLSDHPGFLPGNFGFEVIHADWPAYPLGHGTWVALMTLADFPRDTRFYSVDTIDECTLFVAGSYQGDPYNENLYHVAIWDEDLLECSRHNFVAGIYEVDLRRVEFPEGYISVTESGQYAMLVYELTGDLHPTLGQGVVDLLLAKHLDAAVTTAAKNVEANLRRAIQGSDSEFGRRLVEKCFGENGQLLPVGLPNSKRLALRSAFRFFFKYIRNDFAHNMHPDLDLTSAARLLRRSSELLDTIEYLRKVAPEGG
jgi:hypothetical protein